MKSDCWKDYTVNISVTNNNTHKPVFKNISLKKGELWSRHEFECNAREGLVYKATFSPAIWKDDAGHVYSAKRIWFMPMEVEKNVGAWNIPLCFPVHFSGVPMPLNVNKACDCKSVAKTIPEIPEVIIKKTDPS